VSLVERMQVAAIGVVQAYTDRLMRELAPLLEERYGARADAIGVTRTDRVELGEVFDRVREGELTKPFLERMFHLVDAQAANDLQRVVPVPMKDTLPRAAELQQEWVERNTSLIRLEQRARQEVARIVDAPIREGVRVEEIRDRIQARMNVVRSRAELIARDQTLKLYGQIQEERQTQAGIEEYTWSTSLDERVRGNPSGIYPKSHGNHWKLEGRTFRWDDPPVVDEKTGRKEHPGGDFQCRCAAIPVLSDDLEPISEVRQSVRVRGEPANDIPEDLPEPTPDPVEQERQRLAEERAQREAEREAARLAAEQEAAAQAARAAAEAERVATTEAERIAEAARASRAAARAARTAEAARVVEESRAARIAASGPEIATNEHLQRVAQSLGLQVSGDVAGIEKMLGRKLREAELGQLTGAQALAELGPVKGTIRISGGAVEYQLQANGGHRQQGGASIMRTITRNAKGETHVYHDHYFTHASAQGGGTGAKVLQGMFQTYKDLGVTQVGVSAVDVGQYYWPKIGFKASPALVASLKADFVRYLQREAGLTPEVAQALVFRMRAARDIAIADITGYRRTRVTPAGPGHAEQVRQLRAGQDFLIHGNHAQVSGLKMKLKDGDAGWEIAKRELGLK
jgi:SPP1 gp7 family putative phage head morphogenesis protein